MVLPVPPSPGVPGAVGHLPLPPMLGGLLGLNLAAQPEPMPDVDFDEPRKPARPAPTIEWIKSQSDRIVAFWEKRDMRMDEDEQLYLLQTSVTSGAGEVILKNTPFVVVEKLANMIAAQTPTTQKVAPDPQYRSQAQKVEDWLRDAWYRWNKRYVRSQLQNSILRTIAHNAGLRGWVALRVTLNNEEELAPGEEPVEVIPFDPRQVYPAVGRKGLKFVVHRYQVSYGELFDEYPEAEDAFGEEAVDLDELIEVSAYYDDWYYAVEADGKEIVPVTAHEYGFIPWVIVTAGGSPIRATTKDTSAFVSNVGVSIFHGIKSSYKSLNKVLSQLATEVARSANPPMLYYYNPAIAEKPQSIDTSAGAANYLVIDNERAEAINLSPRPSDVAPLVDALVDDMERGSLPRILWGAGANQSGYGMSVMQDAARDQMWAVINAITEAIEQVNDLALRLVRDWHDDEISYVTKNPNGELVGGNQLSPRDIELVGTETRVKFRDISPKDRATMAQLAALLTDKKLISLETARDEYLGLDNPERENELVLSDLIYLDEQVVKQALVPMALQATDPAMFALWQQVKMQEAMQTAMQPAGAPPLPGLPPVPGMQPPPAAPGLPPGVQPPGLPPAVQPPIATPGADLAAQSLGSILGGMGIERAPGVPGAGALPIQLPLV